jgi:ribokinase
VSGTLVVIGAVNVDLVVTAARLPGPGETVIGGSFARHHGGKGGNQAVAAARALAGGDMVSLVSAVGTDDLSESALEALRRESLDTEGVATIADAPTGVALIVVDRTGENLIAVAPGANDRLTSDVLASSLERVDPAVVLASLEVPFVTVRAAGEWCRDHGATFILNPAPALPEAKDLLPLSTYVTPNETELTALGDVPPGVIVIETRGPEGARIRSGDSVDDVAGPQVEAVDATGAGDCFNGVLAAALLERRPLRESVERAVVAAGLSVTTPGAREGMPTRDEIERALAEPRA